MTEITSFHTTTEVSHLIEAFLSLENFQQAWEKVARNKGSAGIDGETVSDFATNLLVNITDLRESVVNSSYAPLPCKQVLIPKQKGSFRELKIPTVRDRIVQQALLNVLTPIMEEQFSAASFAYRPNLSYLNAVEQVALCRDSGYCWVLDADIAQFFDSIDHQQLLQAVRKQIDNPGILCLIKSWISVGIATDNSLKKADKGIPQGAVISPLLANIYLNQFDHILSKSDIKLVRYADDFVVLAKTLERITQAYDEVENIINSLGLELHSKKTQITNFEKGFRFLGHGFLEDAIFPLESSSSRKQTGKKKPKLKGRKQRKSKKSYQPYRRP